MMRFIHMVIFQLRLYVKDSYFVNLVLVETTAMLLYLYLANYIGQTYHGQEWLIAGIMGTWASCTTSAGALGYQRMLGTLPHLLNTVISTQKVLIATLSPAAIYGLIAFPLAGIEAIILGMPVYGIDGELLLGIGLLWLSALILSDLISLLFILTPNALAYESLILTPILLLSGLLPLPSVIATNLKNLQILSPLTLPIAVIYQTPIRFSGVMAYLILISLLVWASNWLTRIVLKRANRDGRLEVF